MDAVAARAGVGKGTIYRRWPSRDGLVAAALGSMTNDLEVPDTGSVRDDLIALLRSFQRAAVRSLPDQLKPRLIALALSNARLHEIFMANVFQPRRRALIEVLERGEAQGELRSGLDVEQAFTMIHGPMLQMALLGDTQAISDSAIPAKIVETLMDGIAAKRAL
jgi:AcrR family transcriptional regulator